MVRSRKIKLTDWTAANDALMQYFEGNKSKLAKHVDMSRTTVTDFFSEKPIGEISFRKICLALRVNWKQVSSVNTIELTNDPPDQLLDQIQPHADLIEQVRHRSRKKIKEQHSRMRLLSGEEIGVDQLYVDVWLLGKPERRYFNTSESLLTNFDIANDRLALSKRIQRNPGFEIANSNSKLIILGKPGSGKTTFLKHLSVDWCEGRFQSDKIAVLIELRRIRGQPWDIVSAIQKELELKEQEQVEKFLRERRLLVFMDGLDEVPTDKLRRNVQEQITQVSKKYYQEDKENNRFILTCRTQIMETIPNGFISVEVADFKPEQVKTFVQNWFMANGQSVSDASYQWEKISLATANYPDLKELTATPVLLSLICIVWHDSGEIPRNRNSLYKRAISWLLRRWNDAKDISEWEIGTATYRQLSIEDKEALLIEIAARKFENPNNFVLFNQSELVKQIARKLGLTNIQEAINVLKAIETQHGLLIERADELWSFSHLTFQEHFTVQWLTQLSPQQLTEKVTDRQWQSVVKQLVKSQQPADRLLRLIKQAIDKSMAQEPAIQSFLDWLLHKSNSQRTHFKPTAIRAFYYALSSSLEFACSRSLNKDLSRTRALMIDQTLNLTLAKALKLDINFDVDRAQINNTAYYLDFDLAHALYCAFFLNRASERTLALDLNQDLKLDHALRLALNNTLHSLPENRGSFHSSFLQLKSALPILSSQREIQHWWSLHGTPWIERLRQMMIKYQNLGHDWQFSQNHQQTLQLYGEANSFLIELMTVRGAASQGCCTEIEQGLLLPWAELQSSQPHLYEDLKT